MRPVHEDPCARGHDELGPENVLELARDLRLRANRLSRAICRGVSAGEPLVELADLALSASEQLDRLAAELAGVKGGAVAA